MATGEKFEKFLLKGERKVEKGKERERRYKTNEGGYILGQCMVVDISS